MRATIISCARGSVLALFAALVIVFAPSAWAATMTVPDDCSLDYAIASADGAENFIGAVMPAGHSSPDDSRISCGGKLGDGNDTILLNGNVPLSGPISGAAQVKRNLTIKSNTGSCVTISQEAYLVVNPGANLTLLGVGMSSNGSHKLSVLDNNGGTLTINGMNGACLFSDNKPQERGLSTLGGILNNRGNGHTTIDGAFFDFSTASDKGGAIYLDSGQLNITSNTGITTRITSDMAALGGAIFVNRDATLNITSSNFRIENNSAGLAGGAIYNDHGTVNIARGNGAVLNVAIGGNTSRNGGGLFIAGGKLSVTGAEIENNSASERGGGAYIDDVHPGTIGQTYFHENSAREGGAIFDQNDQLNITASTFANDKASNSGAIVNDNGGTLNVLNNTFRGQSSQEGIIVNGGRATIAFSTFNGGVLRNNTTDGHALAESDSINRDLFCAAVSDGGGNMEIQTQFCPGDHNDPLLLFLFRNGGPTPTAAVSSGSPAIGAIRNCSITQDQRGALRPSASGGDCTIGAYEYNATDIPPDTVPPNAAIPFP